MKPVRWLPGCCSETCDKKIFQMSTFERRYDIDWIRVMAIGLLLLYHIGIVFQPWGVFLGFLQSREPLEELWPPMALLNVWRIPLLFFVSWSAQEGSWYHSFPGWYSLSPFIP